MRCITMLKIHDPLASLRRGGDGEVPKEVFISTQCRNHTFGTHDFCRSCLRTKVWRSQSRICAIRACDREIENEMDAHLLYPQKEYGKGVYDRMHVVCNQCKRRFIREAKKHSMMPKMFWVSEQRYREVEEQVIDWFNQQYPVPGKAEVQQYRFNLYRKARAEFRRSPEYEDMYGGLVTFRTERCADCRCEVFADQLHVSASTDGEGLCWVCKENRLWALGVHPGLGSQRGLLSRLKSFFKRIDTYRKVVPISLNQECDLMEIINYLTPKVSRKSATYMSQRKIRKRMLVTEWWFDSVCPSCHREIEDSQWVVDWENDLAGCKSCHMTGWSKPFKNFMIPFGLAFDE